MSNPTRTVKVKFDGDAKGLAGATREADREVDRLAKSIDNKLGQSGDRSGKSFASRLGASLSKSGAHFLGNAAENLTGIFSKQFGTAISSNPYIGAGIMAALAGTAAVVGPAAGAIAAAGLVVGFGGGLAALGLVFAAKSKAVGSVWSKTMSAMGQDMALLSRPFEATLIGIAGFFRRTVDAFNPHLAKAFAKMAGPIERFVDDAARSIEEFIPAIDPLVDAFSAVLAALGPALTVAMRNIAAGLQELAASVSANPEALADTVKGVGDLTRTLLGIIVTLNNANSSFADLTGGTSLVTVTFKLLGAAVSLILAPLTLLAKTVTGVGGAVNALRNDTEGNASSMIDAARAVTENAAATGKYGLSAKHAAPATATLTERLQAQDNATAALIQSMFRLQNLTLGLSGAQIGYEAAIDDATASLKENGRTTDLNTAKGRANRTALDQVAQAANGQTQAMLRAGKGNDAAGLTAERARSNFVRIARQMGLSKTEADRMARSMIAIPNVSREARLTADKRDLDAKLAQARAALKDPTLTRERRAKLNADIASLLAQKARAQAAINSLQGKTVVIRYTSTGVNLAAPSSVGRRASGGPTQPNRQYLVGERGPEVLTMGSQGGHVTAAEKTAPGGAAGPVYLETRIEIGGEVVRTVRQELRQHDRDLKRAVKAGTR